MSAPVPTWQECLDAGMTATEAAAARGRSPYSAWTWAAKHGVRFARSPGHGAGCPCRINGRDYPSQAAAARDIGVSKVTIRKLLDDGLDSIVRGKWRGGNQNARRSIVLFGREFPSHKAAACFLRISVRQLHRLRGAGRHDELLALFMKQDAKAANQRMKAA